jgi:hypothetical protein
MGALANHLPSTPKKSPAKARRASKLNQYGRDPQSPSERMRASTDFDADTGYAPLYFAMVADIGRLTSGNSCTILIMTALAKSAGRGFVKPKQRYEWTLALSVAELAEICRCDERTIQRELVALEKRGLGDVKRENDLIENDKRLKKGEVAIRLKYREWESLPDYKPAVIEMPASEETVEDLAEEDEAKPGNQRVTGKKPQRIAAGALSRVYPVTCGVKTFRYQASGPVDLDVTAVIQAGELIVTSSVPDKWLEKLQIGKSTSNQINNLEDAPRHGCRGEGKVDHQRAGELILLFDPILGESGSVLLAMDAPALKAACAAVGDCDHNYLVHFAMQRAGRGPIRKPQFVEAVCREALHSWKASKMLDNAGLKKKDPEYKRSEIDAMIEKEREELAAKRKAARERK